MKTFQPNYITTLIGSVPHTQAGEICQQIVDQVDIPIWPQLPRRDFREGIYVQYAASLPRVLIDEAAQTIRLDTSGDMSPDLEVFYEHYLADDLDYFGLSPEFAAGFYDLLPILDQTPGKWVKGHVVGPLTFGLTVVDQDRRAVFYNDMLVDVIVKNMAMNARWQVRTLQNFRPNVILFVDEPYLGSWGSAYVSIDRDQAAVALNGIFDAIHHEGGLAGVHCCANTDWSILLGTRVDILNLDAYGYLESLTLYPSELRDFLDRGGLVAWGIVPNDETIESITAESLARRLQAGIHQVCEKAAARDITMFPDEFKTRSLITPACGLGSTSVEISNIVLTLLAKTGKLMKETC